MNHQQAPILEAIAKYLAIDHAPFYMPGHKRGVGIDPDFIAMMGTNLFRLDLPELPGLDEPIYEAEVLAANAYGSNRTWFLVNGSTSGIAAMMLAVAGIGDKILIGRNCHKAAIAGLVLCGATPIYVETDYNSDFDLDCGISPHSLQTALENNPDAKAVLLVSPNYFGICGDLEKLVEIAHSFNVPILIDGAHGGHLRFHPDLPMDAVTAGADVVVQSIHKMGSSLTQTAMLHIQSKRVNSDRLDQAVQMLQTTSPNILLLASLDVARRQMVLHGQELLDQTMALSNWGRSQINQIPHLYCLDYQAQILHLDPTRLTVMVNQLRKTGFDMDEMLVRDFDVVAEMPTLSQLVFAVSIGNTVADVQKLVQAFQSLANQEKCHNISMPIIPKLPKLHQKLTPRSAFFSPSQSIPLVNAAGHISTETISPYPPGIPIICPGEEITTEIIDFLQLIKNAGGVINGCSDRTLETIKVVI
ncbi:arginine/lysine/ornithine decarboxylase [Synechococcus sp. PCC 7502]|uniref:aminotransferase class I/II-fold pyridoxal phosphate-dependent enzyme n=1 Tax=Synechococcus sp. PCC 7502 TaxID=1173263 RepID=UPI00029FA295|nr:aminotransferase class I/II-fold pyridoxal phosphate-dependent enzyme [Synechococcus sp. PCC 7502]AFY74855.1 arginine/lysine/ornithine decarboxylase [Synechococcus sp. PCC 7502]